MRAVAAQLLLAAVLWLTPCVVAAEAVRGPTVAVLDVTGEPDSRRSTDFRVEQLVGIRVSDANEFWRGIELEIAIPEALRQYRNSFALYLYQAVTPEPQEGRRSYEGTRIALSALPGLQVLYVHVPLRRDHGFREQIDTVVVDSVVPESRFPLLFTVLPVMKGMPRHVAQADLRLTARPVFSEHGGLQLDVALPQGVEEGEVQVQVDGCSVDYPAGLYVLSTGMHELTVKAEGLQGESLAFGIERGAVTELSVSLERPSPGLIIEAPELVEVYLDGERRRSPVGRLIPLEPGQHTVVVVLGDYRLSRKFTVQPGKNYKISLLLDILVVEE
jgi:hypothetical protein